MFLRWIKTIIHNYFWEIVKENKMSQFTNDTLEISSDEEVSDKIRLKMNVVIGNIQIGRVRTCLFLLDFSKK